MSVISIAQAQPIPTPAKSVFAKLHPQATGVKWDKEDGDYEAGFKENGKSMSVVMDRQTTLKETETTMAVSDLPASVRDYVAKQMPGKKSRRPLSLSMLQVRRRMKPK